MDEILRANHRNAFRKSAYAGLFDQNDNIFDQPAPPSLADPPFAFGTSHGIPSGLPKVGAKRGPVGHNDFDESDVFAPRKKKLEGVIGDGEVYTVADTYARIKDIKARGSVRSEPKESAPFEALKAYAKDAKLARPAPAANYFDRDSVDMYVLSCDYTSNDSWYKEKGGALVRLFGITSEGHSACIYVDDFWPYFYSDVPAVLTRHAEQVGQDAAIERFRVWLDAQMKRRDPRYSAAKDNGTPYVRSVTMVSSKLRCSYNYQRDPGDYLKIECSMPRQVPLGRDVLSKRHFVKPAAFDTSAPEEEHEMDTELNDAWKLPDDEGLAQLEAQRTEENRYGVQAHQVYECDCAFVMRFMVDKNISGCGWVSAPRDKLRYSSLLGKPLNPNGIDLGSSAQVALCISATELVSLPSRAEVPRELRLVSIDIEAATHEDRHFPVPSLDPIICVAVNYYRLKDGAKPLARVGFAVGKVNKIPDLTHTVQFTADQVYEASKHSQWSIEGRRDLLLALKWFLADCLDYDYLMGYNLPFDQSYCNKQADALDIGSVFRSYTRMRDDLCSSKISSFSSKARGTRDTLAFVAPGRLSWDVLDLVKQFEKLRSNKLSNAAPELTGKLKMDMPHEMIGQLWMTSKMATDESRTRVLRYNENDEFITALINFRKGYVWQAQEMARTTGVSIEMIQHRGAGVKSVSLLLRRAKLENFIMPTYPDKLTKRTAAGFGIVPEGTLLKYEREMNEKIAAFGGEFDLGDAAPEAEQRIADELNKKFGVDELLFSPKDSCYFTSTFAGLETENFGNSVKLGKWYAPPGLETKRIRVEYDQARKKGGRLLLFFVGAFRQQGEPGKLFGVAQVTSRPSGPDEHESAEDLWTNNDAEELSPFGPSFGVRWLWQFSAAPERVVYNPDLPWSQERCQDRTKPLEQRQARLLLDLCRLRRAVPTVELDLRGRPIEADTEEAKRRKKKRKKEAPQAASLDEEQANVNKDAEEARRMDIEGEGDDVDDDADKYEGAVVLETIVGLYCVPISTLDFASLYPSLIILHNLCYTTVLTRELIEKYQLKESDKDPATGLYVDPPNNDYTIKESGHIIANVSLRKGIVCSILETLLKRRSIAKGFMGCSAALKVLMLEGGVLGPQKTPVPALNKDPGHKGTTEAVDLAINKFVKDMLEKEKDAISILESLQDIWKRLKAILLEGGKELPAATKQLREELLGEVLFLLQLFDARQNALKIGANSLYGFAGARVGAYPMRPIAEVTTSEGRLSIIKKRDLVEKELPLKKKNAYGKNLTEWEENELVPATELARARSELENDSKNGTKEFDKHLEEITKDGRRPIVIGGDTDSIFIAWPHCTEPNEAHLISADAEKFVNLHFRAPQQTTYEKTFFWAIYNAQKKYAGVMWEPKNLKKPKQEPKPGGADGETQDGIMCKGLESVRRDSTMETSEAVSTVLRKLLVERNLSQAAAYVAGLVEAHRTHRVNMAKLLLSKSLSKPPQDYSPMPIHAHLACELHKRDPATAPRVGDRVPFFVVKPKNGTAKISEMGEDPGYVIANNIEINSDYYIHDMLRPAIRRILEPLRPGITARIFDNVPLNNGRTIETRSLSNLVKGGVQGGVSTKVIETTRTKELKDIKPGRAESENPASNSTLRWVKQRSAVDDREIESAIKTTITRMREEIGQGHEPYDKILKLPANWQGLDDESLKRAELKTSIIPADANQPATPLPKKFVGLAALAKVRRMCKACGSNYVKDAKQVVCDTCRADSGSERHRIMLSTAQREQERCTLQRDQTWATCKGCAGSLDNALTCGATECDNYHVRQAANRDLVWSTAWLEKLDW